MTTRVRVSCINKTDRQNPHERIRNIGGVRTDGVAWKLSEDQAIADIKAKKYEFFVHEGGRSANIVIAKHEGREYLKTENDGVRPDNLLSLPECP